ncbi:ABC transporter permease [Neorhizobium lilium]|uniref:ABC transporter permease n=1 Tax=Neorhizobium lilium TaxID=2503024 RepID=A0A444LKY0_9HYPH|nr:ABC transporter permease [Neorhizobium lilium]RWX80975.1 ABC transporter permease [Neorhizobium lilium]
MIGFILADLRRLWAGAAVVILLVALATALGVTVTLQERALRLGSARAADKFDLVVGAAGSETQLVLSSVFLQPAPLPLASGDVLAKLSADPRVAWAAPIGFGDSFSGYPLVGTTRTLIASMVDGFAEGRIFEKEGEAVLGAAVRLPLGAEIKPMHGTAETGGETHAGVVYRVTGRLKPTGTPWDRAILVPIQAVWHIHGLGHHEDHDDEDHHDEHHTDSDHEHHGIDIDAPIVEDFAANAPGIPAILVKPKSIADAYRLRQAYRGGNTVAVFPAEVLTNLYATLGDAKLVLSAVAAGSQALVAAALILVTVTHVGQRRRQIGALRAFGAPRFAVFAIAWFELFLMVAVGVLFGFLIGLVAARWIADIFTVQSGIVLPVGFGKEDLRTLLLLLSTAALLSAVPAVLAYRQSPAKALRS